MPEGFSVPSPRPVRAAAISSVLLILALVLGAAMPAPPLVAGADVPGHLVVSEVVTGGASASDELVELYNPTLDALPLEGLELVYVSATGATVTRRVTWAAGAAQVPARHHVLVANEASVYAPIADALYSGGMAATGGSVALRIQGAITAIDAVGWGTAASAWTEGAAAPAPAAGESIERLPGGDAGSTLDTGANLADFVVRALPDPQNLGSPPVPDPGGPLPTAAPTPIATAEPTAVSTPDVSPAPTQPPVPTADPDPAVAIATARALPGGTAVTVEGVALTASSFADGGGYLQDATGGIAVLVDGAGFDRGRLLRVTGELDDRFGQRTLRSGADGIVDLGAAADPAPVAVATGGVGEGVEGRLVRIAATITSSASVLTSGTAFDVDDGSGATRLVVGSTTAIDIGAWGRGTSVTIVGVAGQRDSSGSGSAGYRVQPRDAADVVAIGSTPTPTPQPGGSSGASPTPAASASPPAGIMTIAEARAAARNARVRVQGVVTLPPGIVDAGTAAIQDATGGIVLRLSDEVGGLRLGQVVDVSGTRSTKSGMETIRVTTPPASAGSSSGPTPTAITTGSVSEPHEATLVIVRGALVSAARRAGSGTVSMEIDDGSGPLRVVAGASVGLDRTPLVGGAWVEVRGVLGQETTGAQPDRGYRVWVRARSDVRLLAVPTDPGEEERDGDGASGGDGDGGGTAPAGGLADLDGTEGGVIGATLVVGPWPEIEAGGLLWDGDRLVALASRDAARVRTLLAGARLPLAVELRGLRATGAPLDGIGVPRATIAGEGGTIAASGRPPLPPATTRPTSGRAARWVALVGHLAGSPAAPALKVGSERIELDLRCDALPAPRGLVTVLGIAGPGRPALVVPCGGVLPGSNLALHAGGTGTAAVAPARTTAARGGADGPSAPAGILAASLLGSAAVVLAGVAAWARRSTPQEAPPTATAPAEGGSGDDERGAPVLTLVTLPRERSP